MSLHDSHLEVCQHDLKHCPQCDTVFCSKCPREWKVEKKLDWYSPWPSTQPLLPTSPWICTSGTGSPNSIHT